MATTVRDLKNYELKILKSRLAYNKEDKNMSLKYMKQESLNITVQNVCQTHNKGFVNDQICIKGDGTNLCISHVISVINPEWFVSHPEPSVQIILDPYPNPTAKPWPIVIFYFFQKCIFPNLVQVPVLNNKTFKKRIYYNQISIL